MGKKYWSILTLLVSILLLTSCSNGLFPQVLAADTQDIIEQVKRDNDDVFAEIQKNIDLVTELKTKVEEARIQNKPLSLNSAIRDIKVVSESYEKLAGQRDDIRRRLLQKVSTIKDMQSKVNTEINNLKQRQQDYLEQYRATNDSNPEIVRTRKKSLSKAIEYTDAQINLWTEFSNIENDIITELSAVQQRIDSFLSIIDSSAILFREGLNLLLLQRDINEALSLFTSDLPRMEQLSRDMEKSWDNLDYLIGTLTSVSSHLPHLQSLDDNKGTSSLISLFAVGTKTHKSLF